MKPAMFTIYPAIDLKDGRCVRLRQGLASESTVYSDDPVAVARRWEADGAQWLHVVDLDGAFQGKPAHTELVRKITAAVRMPVQVGGGMRTDGDIEATLAAGARRVVLGTRLISDPEALAGLAARYGERLAAGIDARGGKVQVRGWVETTEVMAAALARQASDAGIRTVIYTDTATDGMLGGPNIAAVREVCGAAGCDVIASGGVSKAADVAALAATGCANLAGVIVGKALYDGRVTLPELLAIAGRAV